MSAQCGLRFPGLKIISSVGFGAHVVTDLLTLQLETFLVLKEALPVCLLELCGTCSASNRWFLD